MWLLGLDWTLGSGTNGRNDRFLLLHCPPTTSRHVQPCLSWLRKPLPHPRLDHFEIDTELRNAKLPVCVKSTLQKQTCVHRSVNTWKREHATRSEQPTVQTQNISDNHFSHVWLTELLVHWFLKEELWSCVTLCSLLDPLLSRKQTLFSARCCCINHDAIMSQAERTNGQLHKQLPCSSWATVITDSVLRTHTLQQTFTHIWSFAQK